MGGVARRLPSNRCAAYFIAVPSDLDVSHANKIEKHTRTASEAGSLSYYGVPFSRMLPGRPRCLHGSWCFSLKIYHTISCLPARPTPGHFSVSNTDSYDQMNPHDLIIWTEGLDKTCKRCSGSGIICTCRWGRSHIRFYGRHKRLFLEADPG